MIAIIAGTGALPIAAAQQLCKDSKPFFSLTLFESDNGAQLQELGPTVSQAFYKLSAIIQLLKERNTTEVLFIGKVDKRNLLKRLKYDWLLAKLMAKALYKNDSDVMNLLINELEQHGIGVISQTEILANLFIPPTILCGTLSEQLRTDIALGMHTAEKLSEADIGQTVVVKNGMVLAVEAIEGTDECIARGIALGHKDVVICKTARTTQSDQFDIPTLGSSTLAAIAPGTVAAIAWHSQRTMIADCDTFVAEADKRGITLVSE